MYGQGFNPGDFNRKCSPLTPPPEGLDEDQQQEYEYQQQQMMGQQPMYMQQDMQYNQF